MAIEKANPDPVSAVSQFELARASCPSSFMAKMACHLNLLHCPASPTFPILTALCRMAVGLFYGEISCHEATSPFRCSS